MNYEYQLLQKEVEFLGGVIDKVTKERNMYRTQAMMRMNRIKELEDNERKILKESFDPSS
jgi:hypothetical protein